MPSNQARSILFGINYLPQVTAVEDFSPYRITDTDAEGCTSNLVLVLERS